MEIKKIIKEAGGTAEVGRRCHVTSSAVSQWSVIPLDHVVMIERLTGIPREELRPDKAGLWAE